MEIKEVVLMAKNNDAKAWTELFNRTKDSVYFTALKLCDNNKENAEDVVQETYIRAMQNISSLSSPEAFVAWICRIAVNVSRNYWTKNSHSIYGTDESDELLLSIPETEENFLPVEYASKRETARIIMRIIDSLPEKQRVTVILYYYNEIPVARIATMMEVSENTVKSRLNYARTEIKCQVETLEKKGTMLHATAAPFLMLALREAANDYILAEEAAAIIVTTIGTTAATVATTTVATTVATSGGIMAKIAALPVVTKIIAGVTGAALLVGGGAAVVSNIGNESYEEETSISESLNQMSLNPLPSNSVNVDSDKKSNHVYLTPEQVEEYSEFDVTALLNMTKDEIIDVFGDVYAEGKYTECDSEGNVICEGDAVCYSLKFTDDSGNENIEYVDIYYKDYDHLYPDELRIRGTLFPFYDIEYGMHIDDVGEHLTDNGFERDIYVEYDESTRGPQECWLNFDSGYGFYAFYYDDTKALEEFLIWSGDSKNGIEFPEYDETFYENETSDWTDPADDFLIETHGDTATIIGYKGYDASLEIPGKIDGYTIIKIGDNAFFADTFLESVSLPSSVTEIGEHAFELCVSLKNINIPKGVTKIGDYAFSCCYHLANIDIPDGVTQIGSHTFYECSSFTSIDIPEGVTKIGDHAFSVCDNVTSINIPGSVTEIGDYAFYNCRRLEDLNISKGVVKIGEYAFNDCRSLENVYIPESVTEIGFDAFYLCPSLAIETKAGSAAVEYAEFYGVPYKIN